MKPSLNLLWFKKAKDDLVLINFWVFMAFFFFNYYLCTLFFFPSVVVLGRVVALAQGLAGPTPGPVLINMEHP